MVHQVKSRSQRRMEKKQAILLVFLLLGISLVSFFLGIMVGRSGSSSAVSSKEVVINPLPVVPKPIEPQAPPVPPVPAEPEPPAPPAADMPPEPAGKPPLTFYDSLPKGEQPPLGSGINLPPEPVAAPQAPVETAGKLESRSESKPKAEIKPEPKAASTVVADKVPVPSAPVSPPAASKMVSSGGLVVQVASFKQQSDAEALRNRLAQKGYMVFVQAADLGEKGTWYRIVSGPYADATAAGQVAERLKNEEKLSGIVKKQ